MPDRLILTKNAQFYLKKDNIDDLIVSNILSAAIENLEPAGALLVDVLRQEKTIEGTELFYKYSTRVYPTTRPVYFIDESIEDRIFAFILLIEYQNYLAVFKKSCANINDTLEQNFILVDSTTLTSTFNDNDVDFQKIALRNMTVSDRAMRARTYEAADLKGLLSTHSAGRSIPYYLKLRQGAVTKTFSGTGRFVESSERISINEAAVWVKDTVNLILNPSKNNSFLDSFAKKIDLTQVLTSSNPNAILIESTQLQERIERESLDLKYITTKNKQISISSRVRNKLFLELEKTYELDSECKVIGREACSKLRTNHKSLTLHSKILTRFRIAENGKELTLQKYIVKNGLYSITFTNPKYMYFMGSCFEDSSGISEINSILEILQPQKKINKIKSEKGDFLSGSSDFDSNSMFSAVEKIHQNDDYIFCDDLGTEWADHITLNKTESSISFIHSKHGNVSTSASNLHDVVGQGIKNLGNMYFSKDQLISKVNDKFLKKYNNNNICTNIDRARKGDLRNIDKYLDDLLKDYKLHRKCILSCSFLSKKAVTVEFQKIQALQPVSGHIIQLLWIVSSFAHAVRDMNAIPIIYCTD